MSVQRAADVCAAGAACLFGASLSTIDTVVQIVAGILTAIAAAASISIHVYHWVNRK